ncbi:MAG: hypothetical protein DWI58_02500 [Chloroflexi bacterium]|nr:MAG: hypothetical protein DWI58_02500 [Chloroflexota bacterium]
MTNDSGLQQSESWYQSTPLVIGALVIAPPLGLYLMWDDLHWSNITRWLVTAIVWLFLLSFVTDFREHLGYDIYLIVVTIAVAYWATRRGPRQERIEAYLKVVANRVLFTNNEQLGCWRRGADFGLTKPF